MEFVLTIVCPDKPGIVYAVSSFLVQHSGNILASQQFDDRLEDRFFMRVHFETHDPDVTLDGLKRGFSWVAESFQMSWRLVEAAARTRTLLMGSKLGHCLNDLRFRWYTGTLPINIPHSFLPSFKGAKPYHQAHERGVKLVGATAHYVTSELDEGPVIEQDVIRVDHSLTPEEFVAAGRDVECQVLARAVKWHAEHRVLLNGHRTVVFR